MSNSQSSIKIEKQSDQTYNVYLGNQLITSLNVNNFSIANRPYFYPVNTPSGVLLTRNYPMKQIEGETKDHVHHTSVWSAWGNINGVDNWGRYEKAGKQIVKSINYETKENKAVFKIELDWTTATETPQLFETRTVEISQIDADTFIFDVRLDFETKYGSVKFGDTKEGGLLSVRVATALDVPKGQILNSKGGRCTTKSEERNVWGKRAEWCSYSGSIDGKPVGIAIIDHPKNPIFPTYWHVRSYGLMTANPFGKSHFVFPLLRGTWKMKENIRSTWRYRLVVFDGQENPEKLNGLMKKFHET